MKLAEIKATATERYTGTDIKAFVRQFGDLRKTATWKLALDQLDGNKAEIPVEPKSEPKTETKTQTVTELKAEILKLSGLKLLKDLKVKFPGLDLRKKASLLKVLELLSKDSKETLQPLTPNPSIRPVLKVVSLTPLSITDSEPLMSISVSELRNIAKRLYHKHPKSFNREVGKMTRLELVTSIKDAMNNSRLIAA